MKPRLSLQNTFAARLFASAFVTSGNPGVHFNMQNLPSEQRELRKDGTVAIRTTKVISHVSTDKLRKCHHEKVGWWTRTQNRRISFLSHAFTSPSKRTQAASSSRSVDGKRQTERGKRPILSCM